MTNSKHRWWHRQTEPLPPVTDRRYTYEITTPQVTTVTPPTQKRYPPGEAPYPQSHWEISEQVNPTSGRHRFWVESIPDWRIKTGGEGYYLRNDDGGLTHDSMDAAMDAIYAHDVGHNWHPDVKYRVDLVTG